MTVVKQAAMAVALPKGRMQQGVLALLADAGIHVRSTVRGYRPTLEALDADCKILKPQAVVEMLASGTRDVGFAGADWVAELGAELVEVLDTGLDPVRVVAAAPSELLQGGRLPDRPLVVASEYARLTRGWMMASGIQGRFVRSYGATEVLPPEDADCIVDNTATGATLAANGLRIVEELLGSSTRLYASRQAMSDPAKRTAIEDLTLVLRSVLDARRRVMVELNVPADRLEAVVAILPCMREPTISPLYDQQGFAVRAAVPRSSMATLIPALRSRGGQDIVVSLLQQVVV